MAQKMKYVIEHMEQGFTKWVVLEYSQIIRDVGKENLFLVSLPKGTTESDIPKELIELGLQWTTEDIVPYLTETNGVSNKDQLCLLDPRAEIDLQPNDANEFKYFIFGGILGDHPPRDRTGELKAKLNCPTRRLGNLQMTTDTAVRTTQIILEKETKFEDIKFIDYPEIRFSKHEATEMPFRYVLDNEGTPIFPTGMVDLIHAENSKNLDDFF
ncbi:protein-arginine N-methyltransferase [Pichia kluyveri]|uniref:Protein-arginine N-methyltransferase n=1 Tax=Pichia kluyveri TaxID=36015 RepID=A0AAV5RCR8_PICKL|nr:protein-arginine N-methyltransferase [Pichia kluyveri]